MTLKGPEKLLQEGLRHTRERIGHYSDSHCFKVRLQLSYMHSKMQFWTGILLLFFVMKASQETIACKL